MRLDYKLLWVEDEVDWVDTYKEALEEYLYSIGFKLEVCQVRKAPRAEEISSMDLDKYHLIFMDYELGAGSTGRDVIQSIRQAGNITEVVFYSANPHLYSEIRESALEGVYWANRDDQFEDRVKSIITLTIRRVMDLPAMRGLAVTEVSDIDHLMEEIITKHFHTQLDEDGKAALKRKIYKKIKDSAKELYEKACGDESRCMDDIVNLLEHGGMDSNKRWRAVKNVIASCTDDQECLGIFEEYPEILKQRNDLAHGHTKVNDGVECVVGKNSTYELSHATQIRQDLLKHRDNFEAIYGSLSVDKMK